LVTANGALDLYYTSGGSTAGNFALNLNGGTLAVNNLQKTSGGGTQTSTVNFNGGVLEALASDPTGSVFLPFQATGLTVNVMGGGAIINTNGFSDTIAQPMLSGTATDGGLTKNGAGTLILTASNTYAGPTTVNAGSLVLTGSAGTGIFKTSAVTVAAAANLEVDTTVNTADTLLVNGQLSGNGGTVGPVNVTSTGALAPGLTATNAVAGNLTADGNVSFATTSVFSIRLGVATALDSDQLTVSAGSVNLNDAALSLTLGNAFNGAGETPGFLYVLINGGAAGTGTGTDVFSNAPASGSMVSTGGSTFEVLYGVTSAGAAGGSDVDLEFVGAIPEPGTWAEMLAGAAVLCIWQRSRRKGQRTEGR
jgi:autotransporter-associated beta strand protein